MSKRLAVFVFAVSLVTPAFVHAQQPRPNPASQPATAAISAEDTAAYFDARIAAVKVGLELTPAQEKAWPAVEALLRDMQKRRAELLIQERNAAAADPAGAQGAIALLRRRADAMVEAAADLKRLADTAEPLYNSLGDSQKKRFLVLLAGLRA
jgi:zinc resistance-associated protein